MTIYEPELFWYAVLFRRVLLEGSELYSSVYEMLQDHTAEVLVRSDLGLFWDKQHNYLVLFWKEAREHGILSGWADSIAEFSMQRQLIAASDYAVKRRILRNMGFTKKTLFFVDHRVDMDDYVVFDLANMDAIKKYGTTGKDVLLPTMKLAKLNNHVSRDKQEARSIMLGRRTERKRQRNQDPAVRAMRARKARRKREFDRQCECSEGYVRASSIVWSIPKELGVKLGKHGRTPFVLSAVVADKHFDDMLRAYINGKYDSRAAGTLSTVQDLLLELRQLLDSDDLIPAAFRRWLVLLNTSLPDLAAERR